MTYLHNKKIKTKNINNSIGKFATEHLLKTSEYEFNINQVDTYIKTISDDDFLLYKDDPKNYYNDKNKLINEHVQFQQFYIITIKAPVKCILDLDYTIKYTNNNSSAFMVLNPDSHIPYKTYKPKEIYLLLLKEVNKIKAQNKILVNIFDNQMKEKLKAFTKYLYQGKFSKKIKIPLFDGIEPEITINSKLIMHFFKKRNSFQIAEVNEGELLVEYIKPMFGKNGLNAFGEIITNNYSDNKDDLEADIDSDTIEILEDDEKKLYKSKIRGYVHFDEKEFYIDNKIKMSKLSRVQNALTKDEANNIEVTISQNDTSVDSIGEGVKLTSETIHINGHVGAKSILEAVNLKIDGATHQESIQKAKFADINRHKGKLRCHKAKIKLLEGGEVHATYVEVEASLGGTIYAEDVIIGHVKNNLKVYASNSITIRLVSGEDNLFKINYRDIPTLNSKLNFLDKEIEDLKYTLEGALKHTQSQVPILKDQIKKLQEQKYKIVDSAKSAKITITEPLNGLNTITFTLNEEDELMYKTDARLYKPFYLEESDSHIILHPTDKKISLNS
ncbi:flagellar assembly protein A [Candidatus Sulfurimonas marisnigri]|uniref:flagellar assembly protein A n=1 Tax=Candidatus Sulfurimonas marisnigri TaxID=2740405 RepID=UPI001E4D6255|nr:flagellar assembly protein A [Candidatus Sulfurimonas marisnigri]